ncbi:MAG TPA: tRNA 4-thiouridine(8) synthase ThiI [Clostridia bacterium]|jgi:thiamine biosynthesis protein ThiI|nr:tRNA 4-thiouridine(8) synthase ThiI [Clostridia bacterium]
MFVNDQRKTILVRYGEIGLKGKNRSSFESALIRNMRSALEGVQGLKILREHGRIYVQYDDSTEKVAEKLSRVFGIVSLSPVITSRPDIEDIKRKALEGALKAGCRSGVSFKVETRRADKRFSITSPEVSRLAGGFILENIPGLTVDVHNPQVVVHVEIRAHDVFVYSTSIPGPGGLPVGVTGRGALMLSGGIDSPVAGWLAMKRGIKLVGVHFYSFPFTSERSKEKVLDLSKVLASYGGKFPVYVVPFTEIQKQIKVKCPESLYVTIMRRMMFRITEAICAKENCSSIFTGENLAQVASQTIESIAVIEEVVSLPILRPVITMDKTEIIEVAKRIGTYDISIRPYEDCCTIFVPKNPATKPKLRDAEAAEELMGNYQDLLEQAVENSEIYGV